MDKWIISAGNEAHKNFFKTICRKLDDKINVKKLKPTIISIRQY